MILWIFSGLLIIKEVTTTDFYNKEKIKQYIPLVLYEAKKITLNKIFYFSFLVFMF